MHVISLFSGCAGLDIGFQGAFPEARTVCYVERSRACRQVLLAGMHDGSLDVAPIHGDIRSFDGRLWRGVVDCVIGGFPCQDISVAGPKRGLAGERSGLWFEFLRIVADVTPAWVGIENVPGLNHAIRTTDQSDVAEDAGDAFLGTGFGIVLGGLADLGYRLAWGRVSAADAGAPHRRERIFILAHLDRERQLQPEGPVGEQWGWVGHGGEAMADPQDDGRERPRQTRRRGPGPTDDGAHVADDDRIGRQRAEQSFVVNEGGAERYEQVKRRHIPFPPGQPDNDADRAAWEAYLAQWPDLWCLDDKGRLNVRFAEVFMGFAPGWTEAAGSRVARIAMLGNACISEQATIGFSFLRLELEAL